MSDRVYGISMDCENEQQAQETADLLNSLFSLNFYVYTETDYFDDHTYGIAERFDTLSAALSIFHELERRYSNVSLHSAIGE
jgi:hypothetical protein